ncbi:heme exporter protein C [Desulfonauticus submarinus]|uniref:Heme exporter protein C n=1 Tax=Desulfonauticus submarinus TaxID=206665 RepID=A0A1H0A9J6_9BACT|nr:cytochrome c biogenesis protein CcsA [Desulfonauticus submarinus]SDN30372.1 heme exporter protein C [Desulfonauticus submarinus]
MIVFIMIFGILIIILQYIIWIYAPIEATLGIVQKIFYLHLPFAWWGMMSFLLVFIGSVGFLITKRDNFDFLARASAEIGVLFSAIALVTGSIWAKSSWGIWWTWDPRLTTTLIMWFIYMGYVLIQSLDISRRKKQNIAAVIGIVAFLDVPLVFISARIWRSVHPAVFYAKGGGLSIEMLYTVSAALVTFFFLWLSLLVLRFRQLLLEDRIKGMFFEIIKEL